MFYHLRTCRVICVPPELVSSAFLAAPFEEQATTEGARLFRPPAIRLPDPLLPPPPVVPPPASAEELGFPVKRTLLLLKPRA